MTNGEIRKELWDVASKLRTVVDVLREQAKDVPKNKVSWQARHASSLVDAQEAILHVYSSYMRVGEE